MSKPDFTKLDAIFAQYAGRPECEHVSQEIAQARFICKMAQADRWITDPNDPVAGIAIRSID